MDVVAVYFSFKLNSLLEYDADQAASISVNWTEVSVNLHTFLDKTGQLQANTSLLSYLPQLPGLDTDTSSKKIEKLINNIQSVDPQNYLRWAAQLGI